LGGVHHAEPVGEIMLVGIVFIQKNMKIEIDRIHFEGFRKTNIFFWILINLNNILKLKFI
jgi:hypothetical protein